MPRAEAVLPSRGFPSALPIVAVIAVFGGLALVGGLLGGLVRIGWHLLPDRLVSPVVLHSALMVCGFFGFGISLERAAASKTPLAWGAPGLAAAGTVAALALQPGWAAAAWLAASVALLGILARAWLHAPALHTAVEAAGAIAWGAGTLCWLIDRPFAVVVACWASFLVLTITGERRELARSVPMSARAQQVFFALLGLQGAALVALAVPGDSHPLAGSLWWGSIVLLAMWLLRFDLACRTGVLRLGWALHTARSLRLGYVWMALAGLWGVVHGLRDMPLNAPGPLHMLLLGFVFSLVFGHAPTVLPALLRRRLGAPGPFAFVPVGLMSVGVVLRASGDLLGHGGLRAGAGAVQALAIISFAATLLRHLRR